MVAPLQSNGLLTAGALRGTTTTARGPAARRTAWRWGAGADRHGPRRANLQGHLRRSGHAVSPSRSTTAEEHPRLGCALGPRRGREPERSWTGSPTRTPQARGDSDRARRGRIALQARSPDSIGTRSSGEHGGAGTRDGSPPGIGPGARGNPHMDQRLDGGARRAQELAQWPGPTWGPASPARQGQEFSQSSQWGTAPERGRPENDGFTSSRSLTPFWSK